MAVSRNEDCQREDGAVIPATTALRDAIATLIDPQPHRLDSGKLTWLDPPLQELHDALGGTNMTSRSGGDSARLPLWADCYDLSVAIDRRVTRFWWGFTFADPNGRHPDPTTAQLMVIAETSWRPQDVDPVTDFTGDLIAYAVRIKALLLPETVVLLGKPCPYCGADRIKRRDSGGDVVNTRALSVRADGTASCAVCRRRWVGITELRVLGRMIGIGT